MRRFWHHPLRRFTMQVFGDGLGLAAAYYSAFYLRFNMAPADRYLDIAN